MPVEAEDRQKYEEAVGNVDITHTLSELKDEEIIWNILIEQIPANDWGKVFLLSLR